jgi:uncharacterized protein YhfF
MTQERKRIQFWGEDDHDDHLVEEILSGEKTATVTKADEYHLPEGEYDTGGWEVGDLVDVYDLRGNRRAVVRVTEVYDVRFGDVPEKLWRGEACRSAEHFREAHRRCWPDYDLTPDFEMKAVHFELVDVVEA